MMSLLNYIVRFHGNFGKKLRQNIDFTNTAHFILDRHENCPFLNEQKLCEIYIKLGQNSLCQVCTEHPRYYEWFNGVKECGIGMCCEEAARIILSQAEPFTTYEAEIPYESCDEYDAELYSYLVNSRSKIISYLDNTSLPLNSRIRDVLWYVYTLQQNIDNDLLDDEDIFAINAYSKFDLEPILEFFLTLEPNDPSWIPYLKDCISLCSQYEDKKLEFEAMNPEIFRYLQNISVYFIWRYFLKGTFDEEVLSKVKLMAISVILLKYLFFCEWLKNGNLTLNDCIRITKKYSEEIEYSEDNLFALANASYELDIFSTENLIGLFSF